mmetsp:Transcript_33735/g.104158  ORF Transcript_33735/g.104158 Transcript_33735/m.104158 type:complete len:289 (-) Transcript_33735:481-1347(-)
MNSRRAPTPRHRLAAMASSMWAKSVPAICSTSSADDAAERSVARSKAAPPSCARFAIATSRLATCPSRSPAMFIKASPRPRKSTSFRCCAPRSRRSSQLVRTRASMLYGSSCALTMARMAAGFSFLWRFRKSSASPRVRSDTPRRNILVCARSWRASWTPATASSARAFSCAASSKDTTAPAAQSGRRCTPGVGRSFSRISARRRCRSARPSRTAAKYASDLGTTALNSFAMAWYSVRCTMSTSCGTTRFACSRSTRLARSRATVSCLPTACTERAIAWPFCRRRTRQ